MRGGEGGGRAGWALLELTDDSFSGKIIILYNYNNYDDNNEI